MFFNAVYQAKDIRSNDRDLTSRLDHAGTADQAFTRCRRQQVQLVFRRERRLTSRCSRSNGGRIVHQESRDTAVKQAFLLQKLRPPVDRKGARAPRQLRQLRTYVAHELMLSWIRFAIG